MTKTAFYSPEIFSVPTEQQAKEIILTSEGPGADTDTRWTHETPFVVNMIRANLNPGPNDLILDYGCGIGRLAKELITQTGCRVIGVDISADMRKLSADYVASDSFRAFSPDDFVFSTGAGLRVDGAFSVWVLQHCFAPQDDIAKIKASLKADAPFFVINMPKRAVPVKIGTTLEDARAGGYAFVSDGIDVKSLLADAYAVADEGMIEDGAIPNPADAGAFWMKLR